MDTPHRLIGHLAIAALTTALPASSDIGAITMAFISTANAVAAVAIAVERILCHRRARNQRKQVSRRKVVKS